MEESTEVGLAVGRFVTLLILGAIVLIFLPSLVSGIFGFWIKQFKILDALSNIPSIVLYTGMVFIAILVYKNTIGKEDRY